MRGVCLWRGALCTALMLAACSRTSILDDDLTNVSTGGAVPGAGTGASGGTAGSGTPSAGAPGASGAPSTGAGGTPSTGVAGGGAAGGSDPCAGVTCTTPPAAVCKTTATATVYAAIGTCSSGACSYALTNTECGANRQCAGAGVCSRARRIRVAGRPARRAAERRQGARTWEPLRCALGASRIRIAAVLRQVATRRGMSADRRLRASNWRRTAVRAG